VIGGRHAGKSNLGLDISGEDAAMIRNARGSLSLSCFVPNGRAFAF